MTPPPHEELRVPVFSDGERRGEEVLPVAVVAPGRYRLLASPGFVEGLAADDEFELDEAVSNGVRVVRRGGNLCVWFYFESAVSDGSVEVRELRAVAESLGGRVDGGWSRMVVLTVPVTAGFGAVERALDAAVARNPGTSWIYGNVYDPADGMTALNWWS